MDQSQRFRFFSTALFLFAAFAASLSAQPLPTDVTILTQKDFAAHNYFSVGDALRGVTSVKLERDGSRGTRMLPKMRGLSSSADALILLDGRPLTHEYDGTVDLTQIPLGIVDRIEITRGGAPSAYSAQAVGGAINIVTIRPGQKGLETDLGTGVGRNGEKNFVGKIRGRSNVGDITYAPSTEESGGFSDNEDFQTKNHFANFTRSFNGKGYWGGEYYFHDSRVGLSNGTPVPFEQWNGRLEQRSSTDAPQRMQESQHAKAFLASPLILGGTTYATYTQSWRVSDENATRSGLSLQHEEGKTSTLDLSWRGPLFEAGVQSMALRRRIFPEVTRRATQNGAYLSSKLRLGALTFAPGLRYDHHSRSGNFLAPRLATVLELHPAFLLSATVQRAHRTPTFEELFLSSAVIGNPNLRDEKSTNGDFGFHWTPAAWFGLKSTGFLIRKTNVIAPDASSTLVNDGVEKSRGVETELTLHIGRSADVIAHWTAQESRRRLRSATTFTDSAMSPRHLVFVKLDKRLPAKLMISNEIQYQSEQFELDDRKGLRIPGFYVWNARLAVRILAADMFFAIDNVSRRRYAETIAHAPLSGGGTVSVLSPQPDRTYWIGVSIHFIN